jgi:small subunit ribosomal protein S6
MNDRVYEIMFIVRPDVEEADLDKLIEGFEKNVTDGGGSIRSIEKMGRRRLAYTVRKFNDGFYVLLTIVAPGALITEVERRLRVSEQVIKFITVRIDEEEKRLAKVKAHRDAHVKRSTVSVQPAHPFPSSAPEAVASETPVEVEADAPIEIAAEAVEPVVETPAPVEEVAEVIAEPVSA